jgi:hypothetical protein
MDLRSTDSHRFCYGVGCDTSRAARLEASAVASANGDGARG